MSVEPLGAAKYPKADLSPQDGRRRAAAQTAGSGAPCQHRAEKPTGPIMRTGGYSGYIVTETHAACDFVHGLT